MTGPSMQKVRFGSRLTLGMIIPSVNTEAEPQIQAMLPDGVSLHTTRLKMDEDPARLLSFVERVEDGASLLADAQVDRILFHCTAVTTHDPEMAGRIRSRIAAATSLPVTVTGEAIVAGLRALGAKTAVMATPYVAAVNAREKAYLEHHGITVLCDHAAGLVHGRDFRAIEPMQWYRWAMELRRDDAQAYFLSCAQARVAEIIDAVERDTGRPVVTSNQAALWQALRQSGIDDRRAGFGALFARC